MTDAIISDCVRYRYTLHRTIQEDASWKQPCLFVMLNPSTADATKDDPTIRRCLGFARAWDCSALTVVNLFGFRATDPRELAHTADPVGPDNDAHVREQIDRHASGVIIAAWGAHNAARLRGALQLALRSAGAQCLGQTKDGSPRHPLYVSGYQRLEIWRGLTA
jgi:hypothetical protein